MRQIVLALALVVSAVCGAQVRLPRLFADGMVLQRDRDVTLWGWAGAGERVTARLGDTNEASAVAGADGRWQLRLRKMRAGGPLTLTVRGGAGSEVTLHDVLIGDVFLCSGQSNMELTVSRCMDAVAPAVTGYSNDAIRYLKLPHQYDFTRRRDDAANLGWQRVTPETCASMSATSYFFARHIQESEHVPVGIINSAVGGTRVECWMSRETLSQFPEYADELAKRKYHYADWPDSVARAENLRAQAWEREATAADTVTRRWRTHEAQPLSWPETDIFGRWADGGNGIYWFAHRFTLEAAPQGDAVLRVGAMKDADSVWVNGTLVGTTTYEYPPRVYRVPQTALRQGDNDILVRLTSQSGRASFTKGKLYQVEPSGAPVITLSPQWHWTQGVKMPSKPGSTYFVDTPTGLYNAMIAPLEGLEIKGIVWYQGESNLGNAQHYGRLLTAMTRQWREAFGAATPMVVVQLAGYMQHHDDPVQRSAWCDIREGQRMAATTLPHAALATAADLGESNDIHPQRKDELGRRIGLQMRRLAYGRKAVSEGPRPLSAKWRGGTVQIAFARESGVIAAGTPLRTFAVCGADGRWQWAEAVVSGPRRVTLKVPGGVRPVRVRYAYDDFPTLTLHNEAGLPTAPFELEVR